MCCLFDFIDKVDQVSTGGQLSIYKLRLLLSRR